MPPAGVTDVGWERESVDSLKWRSGGLVRCVRCCFIGGGGSEEVKCPL